VEKRNNVGKEGGKERERERKEDGKTGGEEKEECWRKSYREKEGNEG